MNIEKVHEMTAKAVRKTVSEEMDAGDVMPIVVHVMREYEDQPSITMLLNEDLENLEKALRMVNHVITYDTVSVSAEVWHSTRQVNPMTGEEWGKGELKFMAENYEEGKNLVGSAVVTTTMNQEGEWRLSVTPFERLEDNTAKFDLSSPVISEKGGQMPGPVEDIERMLNHATSLDVGLVVDRFRENIRVTAGIEPTPVFEQAMRDVAALGVLSDHHVTLATTIAAEPGSERSRWLTSCQKAINTRRTGLKMIDSKEWLDTHG